MRKFGAGLALGLAFLMMVPAGSWAQVTRSLAKPQITAADEGEGDETERANKWTVGLVGGLVDGAYIRFASDIAVAMTDGDNLRVLGIMTKGSEQNVHDLLYLKGVDVGLVSADTFDKYKKDAKIKNIEDRIQYISQVHVNTIQLLVRPEIKSIQDLAGKKVAIGPSGASTTALAVKILERYNIKVEPVNTASYSTAMEAVKSGECSGAFLAFAKGVPTILSQVPSSSGLHLASISFDKFIDEYYVPITVDHNDLPNLIAQGESVETLGSPVVLAVYNWGPNTDRFRKVQRFVQYYFERFDKLKKPPFQPQWKEVNLGAKVPGWKRYWYAEEMLKTLTTTRGAQSAANDAEARPSLAGNRDDAKLYNEFLEWKRMKAQAPH